MKPRWDVVRRIWNRSGGPWVSIGYRGRPSGFTEDFLLLQDLNDGMDAPLQEPGKDLFFSALTFKTDKRSNETMELPGILFADLDPVDPTTLSIAPTFAWSTSPGNYQAVWFLDYRLTNYDDWANLNHRMTVATGADKGGWMGSKLLRVPSSLNYKRATEDAVPFGRIVMDTALSYNPGFLDKELPKLDKAVNPSSTAEEAPPLPDRNQAYASLVAAWPTLPMRTRAHLSTENVSDRSRHIVRAAHELAEAGISPVDSFNIIWHKPWNKWRLRKDPARLWLEIQRVQEIHVPETPATDPEIL